MAVCTRDMRESPFRESEWDRRLDTMLQDLESSTYNRPSQHQQFGSYSASSKQQVVVRQEKVSEHHYPLAKSQSEGSLHESAGAMLKDLDNALKASSNYIETHRTVRGPDGTREFHEVRSYSSGGDRVVTGADIDPAADFNLERQVQHMIPLNAATTSTPMDRNYSALQSANMVSSVQQQKTYTTYKVQSNQYNMSGEQVVPVKYYDGERPGSRLKQNIDELDTLLSDLNNARGSTSGHQPDYPQHGSSGHHGGGGSSDDYSLSDSGLQGHVKKTVSSFNEYNYQQVGSTSNTGDFYSRKPPSPLPGRRRPGGSPGPAVLASPNTVRKASPGPAPLTAASSTSYNYNYNTHTSSSTTNGHGGTDYRPSRPEYGSDGGPNYRSGSPYTPSDMRRSSPSPSGPRVPSLPRDGTPSGVSYYSKYHSTHTHQSQKSNNGPMAFPTHTPPHHGSQTIQSPPKRVDELMSELADFDPSIQPSDIVEPTPSRSRNRQHETKVVTELRDDDLDYPRRHNNRRSPSPIRPSKQASTPGPPVYYPPGEVFSTTKSQPQSHASSLSKPAVGSAVAEQSAADAAKGRAQMKREYGYKDKGRHAESDSKGGAAVVPICLPLCCAAPCVIM